MPNNALIKEMLDLKVWAVVGATPNSEKVANHIFHMLSERGYEVYAVNPNYDEMAPGVKCYHTIEELPKVPDVIDFVIPPAVTLASIQKLNPAVISHVWFQPGTYNADVLTLAEEKGFSFIGDGACVMVQLRLQP
jgi:hypothetical protein